MNIRVFKLFGTGLLMLSVVSASVIILVPLGLPQRAGLFTKGPSGSHWLFFGMTITFGTVLLRLASEKWQQRSHLKGWGSLLLFLGFASALALFLIQAVPIGDPAKTASVWWLFAFCSTLGMIEVYMAAKMPGPDEVALAGTWTQYDHYCGPRNIVLMPDGTFSVNYRSEHVSGRWELSGRGDSRQLRLKATREMQITLKGQAAPYQLCARVGDEDVIYQKSDK